MKRIVESELVRTAMNKGAVVRMGGRTINAAAERLNVVARPSLPVAPPAPISIPLPQALTIDTTGLERAAQEGSQNTERLRLMVAALVAELQAQRDATMAPISGWEFKIDRDQGGLRSIRATAIR